MQWKGYHYTEFSYYIKVNGRRIPAHIDDLELLGDLGNGTCGHVVKMRHKPSGQVRQIIFILSQNKFYDIWNYVYVHSNKSIYEIFFRSGDSGKTNAPNWKSWRNEKNIHGFGCCT